MKEFIVKYNLLDSFSKKEINDFLNFLLSKKKRKPSNGVKNSYKKKILSVSTWSDSDIARLEQDLKNFGQWKVQGW